MKKTEVLNFINFTRSLSRALSNLHRIVSDSQQREGLSEEQEALLEKIHDKLYVGGDVQFDSKCIDSSRLKVLK